MSTATTSPSTHVFISYSRTDSERVDRLEAELIGYGFHTWVDRSHLEGGQHWADQIEQAIQGCDVVVVTLSPEAAASPWVKNELLYAQQFGKPLIPVLLRPVEKIPLMLVSIQYIDLTTHNEQGVQQLRQRLLAVRHHPAPRQPAAPTGGSTIQPMATTPQAHAQDPTTVLVDLPAPAPAPELNDLFMQGMVAWGHGDLDTAEAIMRQVVARDPHFGNGVATQQLTEAQRQLLPIQLQRLRTRALDAERRSAWGEAVSAWQAILQRIDPDGVATNARAWGADPYIGRNGSDSDSTVANYHSEATGALAIDQQNLNAAWIYGNLRKLAASGDVGAMPQMWQLLLKQAPHYGDPDGLQRHLHSGSLLTTLDQFDQRDLSAGYESEIQDSIKWAPYGEWIAFVSGLDSYGSGSVRIWNALTGRQVATHQGASIDWAPDGQRFAIVTVAGEYPQQSVIQVWDAVSGAQLATYHGNSAVWAPDGRGVAITKGNEWQADVQIWDLIQGRVVGTFQDNSEDSNRYTTKVVWSPDGQRLAFIRLGQFYGQDAQKLLHVWNASTNKLLPPVVAPANKQRSSIQIEGAAWSPDGQRIATFERISRTGQEDVMIYIRSIKNDTIALGAQMSVGKDFYSSGGGPNRRPGATWTDYGPNRRPGATWTDDGRKLAWANGGQRLALEGMQGDAAAVQVWDTSASRLVGVYPGAFVGWAWDGRLLATNTPKDGGSIDVWDTANGSLVATYQATSAMWSPDHRRLVMCIQKRDERIPERRARWSENSNIVTGEIQVWDVGLKRRLSIILGYAVSWAPDGERLLVRQGDSVYVYRA